MADQKLVDYVKKQLAAGYSKESIRTGLIRYGYDPMHVDQAIKAVSKKKIPIIPILGGIIILIIIFGIVFLFTGKEECNENWQCSSWSACPSTQLQTRTCSDINSCGTILNKPETTQSCVYQEPVVTPPENDIVVIEKECPASCNDNNQCTQDYCSSETDYECKHDAIKPCCGNNICESGEDFTNCASDCKSVTIEIPDEKITLTDVKNIAKDKASSNPDDAVDFCADQETEKYRDNCYNVIAETTNSSIYCDEISSDSRRDNCYTLFALSKDFTVCDKITDKYLKESCVALSKV